MVRYKRSTITMLYILGFFLLCYFPFLLVMLLELAIGETLQSKAAYLYTVTSIFINSALNPLIYCWRMMEIRMAIRKIITFGEVNSIKPEKNFIFTKRRPSFELQTIQPSFVAKNGGLHASKQPINSRSDLINSSIAKTSDISWK